MAFADSGWTLTTADFRQQPVSLEAIDAGGVRVAPMSGPAVTIAYDDFLQLDRPVFARDPAGKFTLFLAGGDRIEGRPIGYRDEQVQWRSAAIGEIAVPLKRVRALVRLPNIAEELDQARTEDKVLLNNGDSVKGIVTNLDEAKLTIQTDSALDIPLDSVKCVYFAATGKSPAPSGRAFRVRLADGSIVTAGDVKVGGQNLLMLMGEAAGSASRVPGPGERAPEPETLNPKPDSALRPIPLSIVTGIEQLNGPVSWLSSRPPDLVEQVPYLGTKPWPTRMDETVGGRPISFAGRTYARGIGVHAYSRLDYALDGRYAAFRTQYAIAQDEKRQYADVTVRIKVDGKTVHEQSDLRADVLSPVVLIDLPKAAKLLTLEVDYGAANDTQDRFNWIEPALLRHRPSEAPANQPQ
jgi:hypothetical protein